MDKINIRNAATDFLVFTKENGGDGIEVRVDAENETIWLTQKLMADLFETSKQNISLHLKNIFESGELIESSVVKDSLTTGSAEVAKEHALSEYSKFRVTQDKLFENAFDKLLGLNEKENETISKQ